MVLSELPDSANALPINHPLPLQGKWTLRITSKLDSVRLSIAHGEPDNRFLGGVDATLELRWESPDAAVGDAPVLLASHIWAANQEGTACTELGPGFVQKFPRDQIEKAGKLASEDFDYGAEGSFHVVLRLRRRQKGLRKVEESEQTEQIARRFVSELPLLGTDGPAISKTDFSRRTDLSVLPTPHDVRFYFPRSDTHGLELWANAAMLAELSPFLHDLLESSAVSASPRKTKRPRTEVETTDLDVASALDNDEMDDDSDAETDDYLVEKKETPLYGGNEVRGEFSYRQIGLESVSYTTFFTVLQYLQSGHLEFAELVSETAVEHETRLQYLQSLDTPPRLALPASPKSTYRLAHLLRLDGLKAEALEFFEQSLTVEGAAREFFSSMAAKYPEIQYLVVGFVAEHWAQVKLTQGWIDRKETWARGELPGREHVWAALMDAM